MTRRRIIRLGLIASFLYFALVPAFWPDPHVDLEPPAQASFDQDVEVPIVVSAWHPNVELWTVDLTRYSESTAFPGL